MKVRDRIKELRRVKASSLRPNPRNWRTHPQGQRAALQGVLAEIGYADALLVREIDGNGGLELIDGHLRAETTPDTEVPVLVLDLNEAEADKLLATLDPLAAMAEANKDALGKLLHDLETESDGLQAMLDGLAAENGIDAQPVALKQLSTKLPPAMIWALVGIPTVRFGQIAERIEELAGIEGTIVETTANDG